jgi:hypothetical protein
VGNRAFLPSRTNPPRPSQGPRQNSTAKSTATLISETFPLHQQPSKLFVLARNFCHKWYCHRCASAKCECVSPELVSRTFLPRDWLPAGHDQHKIFCSVSAIPPSVCEYRHIYEFWLQQKVSENDVWALSPTSYIPAPYLLTLGVLRNQSRVRLSQPAFECPFI